MWHCFLHVCIIKSVTATQTGRVQADAVNVRKLPQKLSLCVMSQQGGLFCERQKVETTKFPLQTDFHFSNWASELSSPPRNHQHWSDKSWPLSFQQLPDSPSIIDDSAPPPPQLPYFLSILQILHSSFFQTWPLLALQTPSAPASLSASHLHLSCMKSFNGVNQWENNRAVRRGSI